MGGRSAKLLLPGGLTRITGGNLYDRLTVDRLRSRGWTVEVGEPPEVGGDWDLFVVDSLAFRFGRPQTRKPYVAVAHQLPSSAAGFPEPTVQERDVLRFAGLVVTVSDWLAHHLSRFTASPIEVVPPGRDRAWREEGPDPDADTVLSVGNAAPGKGVPEAIDAFARAAPDGTRMVVVGDMDVDEGEAARVRVSVGRCSGRLELAGMVEPEELATFYGRARVLLTASTYEGWPIAVTEAMASAVPVVGFDVPGLRELVRPGRDGLLARAGDQDDLAGSLADLLDDPDLASAMGRAASHRAMRWPTWAETANRFADVVEKFAQDTEVR